MMDDNKMKISAKSIIMGVGQGASYFHVGEELNAHIITHFETFFVTGEMAYVTWYRVMSDDIKLIELNQSYVSQIIY